MLEAYGSALNNPTVISEIFMILTNVGSVPGKKIVEHFGIVQGSTVRAKHLGRDMMAGLKNLVGGELKGYTELLQESRQEAVDRMTEQARLMGANAVINICAYKDVQTFTSLFHDIVGASPHKEAGSFIGQPAHHIALYFEEGLIAQVIA